MGTFVIVSGIGDHALAFRGALLEELCARGHRVVLSVPKPVEHAPEQLAAEVARLGAVCDFAPLDRTGTSLRAERAAARHYRALFDRVRPDGVFAANPKPVFHAMPAAKAAGVPRRVAMVTGLGYAFTASGPKALLLRAAAIVLYARAMRAATTALFQNRDDLAELERLQAVPRGLARAIVGGSGVDLARFAQAAPPQGAPVYLMVARLLGDKGVREFVEAARIVRSEVPEARFRLAGWIDSNPAAIAHAELDAWVREGVIEFAGRLDDVRPELRACSVFVLPSYREGTPRSVLEALATGRPVVTTDAPGCRETVEDGVNGLLVPVRSARAVADACLRLARDPALRVRMGEASRRRALERFDARAVNAAVIDALGA